MTVRWCHWMLGDTAEQSLKNLGREERGKAVMVGSQTE